MFKALRRACVAVCVLVGAATSLHAQEDLSERAQRAQRIIVGTVVDVAPTFETTTAGDQLIVSYVTVRTDEVLKGTFDAIVTVKVEGGTVGDLSLTVSDMPAMRKGERAVMFLDRDGAGRFVPRDRARGVVKLDRSNRDVESGLSLRDLRAVIAKVPR